MKSMKLNLTAAFAFAALVAASPADAQGKGHGNGHGNGNGKHNERVERRDDRDDDRYEREREERRRAERMRAERRDRDDRDGTRFERRGVPRGWCQGRGNPHNTARNCGYRGSLEGIRRDRDGTLRDRLGRVIMGDGRVYDQRRGTYSRTSGDSRGGSYEAAHADYHRWHDQQCRDRAAQAGGVTSRLRVAAECKAEHDAWHRQQGISHR
jgi:hypothetical protein